MMLKIGDLKVGDELECIDDNYAFKILRNKVGLELKVTRIYDQAFKLGDYVFNSSDIKYFKKKEKYSFDDLIDVAVKAVKDGLIACDDFKRHSISFCVAWDEDDGYELASHHDAKYFNEAIEFIKSLYKETFVIESDNDVNKIKNGESVLILKNGKAFKFSELMGIPPSLLPDIIFGATVEQSK